MPELIALSKLWKSYGDTVEVIMKFILTGVLLALLCTGPAFCQLPQSHPELCGTPNGVIPLPEGMSATGDGGEIRLFFGNSTPAIEILGPDTVVEVCPLPDGRLVVFSDMSHAMSFSIISPARSSQVDTVWGFDPRMSSDQKWIAFRKFYPRQTELPVSDQYLLYDLSKSPAQNSSPDADDRQVDTGTNLYPAGWGNKSGENIGAPQAQRHGHLSTFHWAPDSRSIVFADVNQSLRSMVLVSIDGKGTATAAVLPFPHNVDCAPPIADAKGKTAQPTGLRHVEFGPQQGADRLLFVDFEADGCSPKRLQLHSDAFLPAKTEALPVVQKYKVVVK